MATYAMTAEDVLALAQLRVSCGISESDTSFDDSLMLHRAAAIADIGLYLNRHLVRATSVLDIPLNEDQEIYKSVSDVIEITEVRYVSGNNNSEWTVDTTKTSSDIEWYWDAESSYLRARFLSEQEIKPGSPVLWSIERGIDFDKAEHALIKDMVEAYAKARFLAVDLTVLYDVVRTCLRNLVVDYEV